MAREKPRFKLVLKSKRAKWYVVSAQFEYEDNKVRAKFIHPGDAYKYSTGLLDDWKRYGVPLIEVICEC